MDQNTPTEDDRPPLPEHIITYQIFSRLPVKSLYQFRCVSKWSRPLPTHRGFLEAYHSRRRRPYLLSFQSSMHWDSVFYSIDPDYGWKAHASPINQVTNLRYDTYAKSINGLMCISRNRKVAICQVATNEKRDLRKFPRHNRVRPHTQYIYFCYDLDSERYKVLRAVSTLNNDYQVSSTWYTIFTIGLDKSWRKIHAPKVYKLYHLKKGKSVCIDGMLYCTNFSTSPENVDNCVIARFDVAHEYFQIILYPEGLSSSRYSSCYIIELKGSLCVVDTGDLIKSCFMTMWAYDSKNYHQDYESWIEYRIEFPSCWQVMVNLWHNCSFCSNGDGEIVVAVSGISTVGCCILIYNIERKKWRKLEVLGLEELTIMGDFLIEEYVESPALLSNVFRRKRVKYSYGE